MLVVCYRKIRENLSNRIAVLAIAVINEIMAFGMSAAARASNASTASASTTATSVVSPANQKLTELAKIMIDEVFGYAKQGIDVDSVIRDGHTLSKEINKLAHFVAHSALHAAAVPQTDPNAPEEPGAQVTATEEEFFARLTPLISNLSFRIVNEVSE